MARRRKTPTPAMKELEQKIAGMKSIDPHFDAGNGVTLTEAEAILARERTVLEAYNSALAMVDDKYNALMAADKETKSFNKKVLPATGLKYGTDSSEYEQAGGVRESERKRPVRRPKPVTS